MPLPPPPPRMPTAPLAPPPPPAAGPGSHANKQDRSALLSQIRGGTRLKKAVTNDRSSPIVQKSKQSGCGNGTKAQNLGGPMGLGGLMSQGMPKLRPPGSRAGERNTTQQPNFVRNGVNKTSTPSQSTFSVSEIQRNKQGRVATNMFDRKDGLECSVPLNETTEKPLPPSSKLKPSFMPPKVSNETTTKPTPPPSKLKPALTPNSPAGFQTKNVSNSTVAKSRQLFSVTNDGAKEECPMPTFPKCWPPKPVQSAIKSDGNKPLSPSKVSTTVSNAKTSLSPSATANVTKGNGLPKPFQPVTRNHTFSASNIADYKGMSTLPVNFATSPVRNNSAPDKLDQLTRPNAHRPPPPPIPASKFNQSPSLHHSSKFQQNGHLSPTAQPNFIRSSEPPPLPKSAPPPLPHRSPQTLPRRVGRVNSGPIPPTRSFSKQNNQVGTQEFESRFKQMFRDIHKFPFPSYKITPQKFYMSQAYTDQDDGTSINQQTGGRLLLGKAAEC